MPKELIDLDAAERQRVGHLRFTAGNGLYLANSTPPRVRPASGRRRVQAAEDSAELPLEDLADETLSVLSSDPAVPPALRSAAKGELRNRGAGATRDDAGDDDAQAVAASHGGRSRGGLVGNMEKLATERRKTYGYA